jgi:hypothetical protein
MSSFINDEKGVIEPYTELPAMALAVVGFIVFIAVLTQAYTTYQEKSFIAGHYQDAANLAQKLGRDSILTGGRPGVIDRKMLKLLTRLKYFNTMAPITILCSKSIQIQKTGHIAL